ncbi:TonB-dependent receptor domain-containing protein [Hymenobacter caeli]|uniref:Iron complex outermembrane receptor protein n=1 Tax=Hymenobacter caeli TaxID=2735894 RepID=A0ABX2FY56_9BACT|nr:TonB-dependent receptor [Hymenobacter caeli]NRT21381.1 iron complex outermembrane receptor protein [Hymenobacter caeli]
MNKKLLIVPFVLASSAAWAQSQSLAGQVLDDAGRPVIGATVVEKGTNNGIGTDANGRFVLRARTAQPRLVVSALGYTTQEVAASGASIAVRLATSSTALEGVQVVGSRSLNRSVTDSPSPVDIIDVRQVTAKTGQLDVNQLLQFVAPSFNSNRQTGADGADHVDPASLRGLGPDQTLVLVNGKRWHQSSLVNLFGSRGRGNTGTDLNTIPAASIERIEILRDGASAQYGSDAIAGVINIVLKTSTKELTANVNYGAYQAKYRFDDQKLDGGNFNANLNYGLPVGKGGFVNATVDFNQREHTQRANVPAPDGIQRRQYGDPRVFNTSVYVNSKLPLSEKVYAYVFGGFNARRGEAYAYTRFPTIGKDSLGHDIPNPRSNATLYPDGFDPVITSNVFDGHGVTGVRGTFGPWDMDLSNGFGSNRFHYGLNNSLNATLGVKSPTIFDAGGFQLQQDVVDLNVSRNFKTVAQGLNLAFGGELRREWYQIFAGEPASYTNYQPGSGIPGGSQGFPGFQPRNELHASRNNVGVYADAELDVTKAFLVEGAVRYEHYSDFGSNVTGKLATRLKLSDNFALRGTLSTGFRAPSLAQINFNTVFTNVVGGVPIDVLIDRNNGPVTRAVGIPPLTRELSRSASVGFTGRIGSVLSFTVDGYYIHIQDRIVLTGAFPNDDNIIGPTLTALNVGQAQFFANAASTSTFGLDAVVANTLGVGTGRLTTTLAANLNRLNVTSVQTTPLLAGKEDIFFGQREQAFVKASAPPYKINLTGDYNLGRFGALLRFVYFGPVDLYDYTPELNHYHPRLTTDVALSYALTNQLSLSVGSSNVFNKYPDFFNPQATETGGAWDPVQMGSNGRFLFAKLQARF